MRKTGSTFGPHHDQIELSLLHELENFSEWNTRDHAPIDPDLAAAIRQLQPLSKRTIGLVQNGLEELRSDEDSALRQQRIGILDHVEDGELRLELAGQIRRHFEGCFRRL